MTTHSNIPKQNQYVGQIKNYSPNDPTFKTEYLYNWINDMIIRYEQVAEMRRDITNFAEEYANLNEITFFTNEEETWYLGPKSPNTRNGTLAGGTWIFDISLNNPRLLPRIRTAIKDMNESGRRIKRKRPNTTPNEREQPK